jgi:D-alanine-D-alanine ligase
MKVAVLHGQIAEGAPQDELDVLVEAEAVCRALSELGHESIRVPFSIDFKTVMEALHSIHPALVFNLVEAVDGIGRLIHAAPSLLDYLKIPYTGAETEAIFLSSNKLVAKRLLKGCGIPTPQWFTRMDVQSNCIATDNLYIIKSLWEHASIGLDEDSVISVTHSHQLHHEMECRQEQLGGDCFAEVYIPGREFNISLLSGHHGPQLFPAAEILFEEYPEEKLRVVGYRAKWHEGSFEYAHTPRTFDLSSDDEPLVHQLNAIAKECWSIFGLRGYARVDFRVDQAGAPWVLEVNANPCISPEAGFIAAAERAGLTYNQVIQRIIEESGPHHR